MLSKPHSRTPYFFPTCITLIFVAAGLGCGERRAGLAPVTGRVTLDGQPLADALVKFTYAGETATVSMGRTDSDGRYEMEATRTATGAHIGTNKVEISTYDIHDNQGKLSVAKERVPAKYNSATELTAEVKDENNVIDFSLSTAGAKIDVKSERLAVVQ